MLKSSKYQSNYMELTRLQSEIQGGISLSYVIQRRKTASTIQSLLIGMHHY